MLFSIIIPVYNIELYIKECIDSIVNQNFNDYEIILVDDGSNDGSGAICDEYQNKYKNIKVIHQANSGLSEARNEGLKIAKGDYIIFVDGDDYLNNKNALMLLSEKTNDNPEAILFGTNYYICKSNKYVPGVKLNNEKISTLNIEKQISYLVGNCKLQISAWIFCLSKKFIFNNSLFFKKGIKSEDIEWGIRLYLKIKKLAFLDSNIYVYRIGRNGSITNTIDYKHLEQYYEIIESSLKSINDSSTVNICKSLKSYLVYHILIIVAHANSKKIDNQLRERINGKCKLLLKRIYSNNLMDSRARKIYIIYKIFGYNIMSFVLGVYLKYRRRRGNGIILN